MPKDTRLIERWLPIVELGAEALREGSAALKAPVNRLHVWWARRPLIASRAAILASILPDDADHKKFLHALGIHGDPVASRRRIDRAKRSGERFEGEAYSYPRAFSYSPGSADLDWLKDLSPIAELTLTQLQAAVACRSRPLESV
jgi:putative DNA methylase